MAPAPDPQVRAITDLLRRLVSLPTRAGVDDCAPAFGELATWLAGRDVESTILDDEGGRQVCLLSIVGDTGPLWVMNATIDTAGFGALDAWTVPPTSATESDGWMIGRGTADCKAAVAIFSQLMVDLGGRPPTSGRVALVVDADEHTGTFGGARRFFDGLDPDEVAGVMIGYPGQDGVVVGCRGYLRCRIQVAGRAAHSGGSTHRGVNAIERAAELVDRLTQVTLADHPVEGFTLPPVLTVTGIDGGESFSSVPDSCAVDVDARLTPTFDASNMREAIAAQVRELDHDGRGCAPTRIDWVDSRPAYRLEDRSPVAAALLRAATEVLGRTVPARVAGPTSVGNHLAAMGIEATAGFGVAYRNIHAADEAIDLATIDPTYRTYRYALRDLLSTTGDSLLG